MILTFYILLFFLTNVMSMLFCCRFLCVPKLVQLIMQMEPKFVFRHFGCYVWHKQCNLTETYLWHLLSLSYFSPSSMFFSCWHQCLLCYKLCSIFTTRNAAAPWIPCIQTHTRSYRYGALVLGCHTMLPRTRPPLLVSSLDAVITPHSWVSQHPDKSLQLCSVHLPHASFP